MIDCDTSLKGSSAVHLPPGVFSSSQWVAAWVLACC